MKHLLIIGARGFGREVYVAFKHSREYDSQQIDVKGFLDDKKDALEGLAGNWPPIVSSVENYEIQSDDVFFCALGDSKWRKYYADMISAKGGKFISIIDKTALVSPNAVIGEGCIIGAFTCISTNISIGKHVMVQSYCNFGHDVSIGDYASIESYVFLGGYASVGESSVMHTKSSIIPHKSIANNCSVGFGSVVMRNFKDGVHVFGNPAQKIKM